MPQRYKDRVVWITGASSGIGEALANAFYAEGAFVVLSARRTSELERVKGALGERAAVLPLDLEDFDAVSPKAKEAAVFFGPIDVLVNNAGVSQRSLVKETDFSVDERIMRIDYLAQVAVTKAVLPSMLERGRGDIVVISSVAGYVGTPLRSGYAAAKHALRGYFDSLRAEVHDAGLRVLLVYPGYVNTPITLHALRGDGAKFSQMGESQEKGMSAESCAKKILDATAKGKAELYVGGKEVAMIYLKRFFPSVVERAVRRLKVT